MKKIISLILCAVLAFSVLTCAVSAQTDESASDDYSYVTSSVPTTERPTEMESVFDEFFGDNLRDKRDDALKFFEGMRKFLEKVVDFFKSVWDYLMHIGENYD